MSDPLYVIYSWGMLYVVVEKYTTLVSHNNVAACEISKWRLNA